MINLDPIPLQNQSETQNPAQSRSQSATNADASASSASSHQEALADDLARELLGDNVSPMDPPSAPSEMSQEQFAEFFYGLFQVPRLALAVIPPRVDLQSLNVSSETPGAPAAAAAAYNVCSKVPALRPLLRSADNPVISAIAVAIFTGGIAASAVTEYRAVIVDRAAKREAMERAAAATTFG